MEETGEKVSEGLTCTCYCSTVPNCESHCESFPARKVALQRGVLERSLIKGVADVEYR